MAYLVGHPCVDCGETDVRVLEFDHRGHKRLAVSLMIRTQPWPNIEREILKCEVRCANCHRRKTLRELGWPKFTRYFRREAEYRLRAKPRPRSR